MHSNRFDKITMPEYQGRSRLERRARGDGRQSGKAVWRNKERCLRSFLLEFSSRLSNYTEYMELDRVV